MRSFIVRIYRCEAAGPEVAGVVETAENGARWGFNSLVALGCILAGSPVAPPETPEGDDEASENNEL
jgi:hypothetical protein